MKLTLRDTASSDWEFTLRGDGPTLDGSFPSIDEGLDIDYTMPDYSNPSIYFRDYSDTQIFEDNSPFGFENDNVVDRITPSLHTVRSPVDVMNDIASLGRSISGGEGDKDNWIVSGFKWLTGNNAEERRQELSGMSDKELNSEYKINRIMGLEGSDDSGIGLKELFTIAGLYFLYKDSKTQDEEIRANTRNQKEKTDLDREMLQLQRENLEFNKATTPVPGGAVIRQNRASVY